jgi:hypothetical protein
LFIFYTMFNTKFEILDLSKKFKDENLQKSS